MTKPLSVRHVAFGMLSAQLVWTLWYLGILFLINIIRFVFGGDQIDLFYNHSFVASNVYMLVIGIIAIYFMPYFVENGVTRKNYFFGNVIASICLSLLIPGFSFTISIFEKLILSGVTSFNLGDVSIEGTNFIGDLFQSILLTPYIDVETNAFLSIAVFSLNIFSFYIIGWLIGSAFYRLGVVGGLLFIAVSIVFIVVKDSMQRVAMDQPIFESFSIFQAVPESFAMILVFIILVVVLVLIRALTKRAPIKIQ